jgi:thiol:disulfide interchange protein DsbC
MSRLIALAGLLAVAGMGLAADGAPSKATAAATAPVVAAQPAAAADPRIEIAKRLGAKPEDIRPSQIPGIYEFAQGMDIGYVTSDGKYFFGGDLYDVESRRNLTDERRGESRRKLIASVPESEMIIFSPAATKYTVTVFTDIDCGYCRKLHSQIREYNNLGVRVRYMFYPRNGPGTESWKTAEAVWCAKNRNDALTRAKKGEQIEAAHCGATPVARQFKLGEDLGIRGTPGIFTNDGAYFAGYLPPAKLVQALKESNP